MSKGSTRRPRNISEAEETERWERCFGKGKRLGKQERQRTRSAREEGEEE